MESMDTTNELPFKEEQSPVSDSESSSSSSSSSSGESVDNGSQDDPSSIVLEDIEDREGQNELESTPPGSPLEMKSLDVPEQERVFCCNNPNSRSTAALAKSSRDLWMQFDAIGTEMIVTRRGRRMFPPIKVELFDLNPNSHYVLLMDMAPVDKYRYKYQTSSWVRCFEEECSPTRLYVHPDSPALGSHWMNSVINFYKLKLTNNQLDKQGHIIVNSMHKYQPRLHVVETSDINNLNWENFNTFIFPGTQFTTVTAYQNDRITQLKIENNPFAKGFRSPFSRCRTRNNQRITLRSTGSDSSEDSGMFPSPFFVHPPTQESQLVATLVNRKRKSEGGEEEQAVKQICLATPDQGVVKVTTGPKLLMNPGPPPAGSVITAAVPNQRGPHTTQPQSPVLIYVPVVQTTAAGEQQKTFKNISSTPNGLSGQTVLYTSSIGQSMSSPRIIQTNPTSVHSLSLPQQPVVKPPFISTKSNDIVRIGPVLQAPQTVIQANGRPATVISPHSILNAAYTTSIPQSSTTTTMPLSVKSASNITEEILKVREGSDSKLSTPCIDISTLTKCSLVRKTSSPPPLVKLAPEDKLEELRKSPLHNSPTPPPPQSAITILPQISEASPPTHPSSTQNILVQAPATAYTTSQQQQQQKFLIMTDGKNSQNCVLMPVPSSSAPAATNNGGTVTTNVNGLLQSQTQIPIVYDQQIVTPIPVYRFNTLNTAVQPIQILATIPAAPQNTLSTVKTV